MEVINIGITADDGTGDPIRTAFDKTNDNFSELLAAVSGMSGVDVSVSFDEMVAIQSKLSGIRFVPQDYTLAEAAVSADCIGKTIHVTSPQVVTTAIAWPADRELVFDKGGYVTFTGDGALTGLKEARPEWFNDDFTKLFSCNSGVGTTNIILTSNKIYPISVGIIIDYTRYNVNGNGATLDFSGLTSGTAITIVTGELSGVFYKSKRNFISGIHLDGNSRGGSVTAIKLGDGAGTSANVVIKSVSIRNFGVGLSWSVNAYNTNIENIDVYECGKICYYPTGLTNAGEKIVIRNGVFYNSDNGFDIAGGGYFHFNGCSFDYIGSYAINAAGGAHVLCDNCFFETNTDSDVYLKASSTNTFITLKNSSNVIMATNRTNFWGSASDNATILLDTTYITTNSGVTYVPDYLFSVASNGRVKVQNIPHHDSSASRKIPYSNSTNLLDNGGFVATGVFNEWQYAETATVQDYPTVSALDAHTGVNSLLFTTTGAGRVSAVKKTWAIAPSAMPIVSLWIKAAFVNASDTFTITCSYGSANSIYSAYTNTITVNQASGYVDWTRLITYPFTAAPPGASSFTLSLTLNNTTGTSSVSVDDILVEIPDGVIQQQPNAYGTWTPVLEGTTNVGVGTYSQQVGRVVNANGVVTVSGSLTWSAHTGTGTMKIKLPYASRNWGSYFAVGNIMSVNLTYSNQLVCYANPGTNYLNIATCVANGALTALAMDTAGSIYFSISYEV